MELTVCLFPYQCSFITIQMILDHESTIIPCILRKRVDLFEQILAAFEKLQGMNVYHRKTGTHVERENTDWINCIMLDR